MIYTLQSTKYYNLQWDEVVFQENQRKNKITSQILATFKISTQILMIEVMKTETEKDIINNPIIFTQNFFSLYRKYRRQYD